MNEDFRGRAYAGDEDLQPICDLINLCHAVDGFVDEPHATVEHWRQRITGRGHDPERDARLWPFPDGRIAAFALLSLPPEDAPEEEEFGGYLYFRVHPDARNREIEEQIFARAAPIVRALAGDRSRPKWLRTGMMDMKPEYTAYRRDVLERNGFHPARYEFRMHRSLDEAFPDPRFPAGYFLRYVENEADQAAWIDAFNLSFIDHWDYQTLTPTQYQQWLQDESYRSEGDLIAVAEDRTIAAFCRCLIDEAGNERDNTNGGWIDLLGTRRGHRGIGLGRAMLLAGMAYLKSRGIFLAILAVDARNPTGALRLYESVGFKPVHTTYTYQKDL